MKRLVLALAAVAALVCGCDKYGDRINDIENRVSALEKTCTDMNTTIGTMKALVEAQASGLTIKEVREVEEGLEITFSNSSITYLIRNGKNADAPTVTAEMVDGVYYWKVNGEWLTDEAGEKVPVGGPAPKLKIEDGEWFISTDDGNTWAKIGAATGIQVEVTEDENAYYFDFGEGNIVTIAKMTVFQIKMENLYVNVAAGSSVEVKYVLKGGNRATRVIAEASGYEVKVNEAASSITIKANAGTEEGYVIVKAIRNSDGATSSQYIVVNEVYKDPGEEYTAVEGAHFLYYGHYKDRAAVNFVMTLWAGDFEPLTGMIGNGDWYNVDLDLYTPESDGTFVPVGVYEPDDNQYSEFSFTTDGTFSIIMGWDADFNFHPLMGAFTKGWCEIKRFGDNYSIVVDGVTEGMLGGGVAKFKYYGPITFEDRSENNNPGLTSKPERWNAVERIQ